MGDKSEAFCRQAVNILSENPGILPRDFDLEGLQRDLATLDALRPRMIRFTKLYKRMQDTDMALGSDLMTGSLEGYAFLKVAGKGKVLNELKKMLAARFSRRAPTASPEDPAASQQARTRKGLKYEAFSFFPPIPFLRDIWEQKPRQQRIVDESQARTATSRYTPFLGST